MERFWRKLDRTAFRERFILTIDGNVSTTELITLASKQVQRDNQFPIYGVHGLFHLESGAEIERERQLADYAVEDGDHFALILTWHDTAAYYIERYRDSEDVFAAIRSTSAQPPISDTEALRGALLYTDEDAQIATYVRKHFASLSEASGPNLLLYVIEQPESDWREASRYWKGAIDEQLQREWVTLGWLRTKPYRPEEAYQVARQLGVYPDELPCMVLFEQVPDPGKLVFPLLDGSAAYFRHLFGQLQRLILPGTSSELTFAGVRREYGSIVEELHKAADTVIGSDRITYKFEGQTVFINKPSGPVSLSDFQNRPETTVRPPEDL
jgi:hypothetical protein